MTVNPLTSSPSRFPASGVVGKFTAGFYVLLTLFPQGETVVGAGFRWVLWQMGLLCPVLWLLGILLRQRRISRLGGGWDTIALLTLVILGISTIFAQSPPWALEYTIATWGYVAAVYALKHWLQTPQHRYQLLVWQGYLNLGFILCSLVGWGIQRVLPAWQRAEAGRKLGLEVGIAIGDNGLPMGNPEALAAYLMLALPLLLGLAIVDRGWRRRLWGGGMVLGLADLYTTHSPAGFLGLAVLGVFGLGTIVIPRLGGKGVALVALPGILLFVAARAIASEEFTRTVTTTAAWQMVRSHLWTGVGLGGVPLLYPRYRPFWAGREAQWVGQLHHTPLQLLAQLGLGGAMVAIAAIGLFGYHGFRSLGVLSRTGEPVSSTDIEGRRERLLPVFLYGGVLAYATVSFFNYSLHFPAIAGTLAIYLAVFSCRWRSSSFSLPSVLIPLAGLGFLGAAIVWLVPVHYAGYLAGRGVAALKSPQPDVASFVRHLTRSYQLVPWKPEYPLQVGWVSGRLHWQDPQSPKAAIDWMQRGIAIAGHQVFGYNRLGWLMLKTDPLSAAKAFGRSAQLIPAQRGVFYGLGRALLATDRTELAIEAFALEILRDPSFFTRPLWMQLDLEPLLERVNDRLEEKYELLLLNHPQAEPFNTYLHQNRGELRWWMGNYKGAREDWQENGSAVSKLVLQLASLESSESVETELRMLSPSAAKWAIEAWLDPQHRRKRLQQAWEIAQPGTVSPEIVQHSLVTMNESPSFDEWLKLSSSTAEKPLLDEDWTPWGSDFNRLPMEDFPQLSTNAVIDRVFADQLSYSPDYFPELDRALQLWREALLNAALQRE
ncbi:MAG: hypothetical protein WA882_19340 [Geitlerinemataceae cyanobacterium]